MKACLNYVQVTIGYENLTPKQNQNISPESQRPKAPTVTWMFGFLIAKQQNTQKISKYPGASLPRGINIQKLHSEPARRRCPCVNICPCDFLENSNRHSLGFRKVVHKHTHYFCLQPHFQKAPRDVKPSLLNATVHGTHTCRGTGTWGCLSSPRNDIKHLLMLKPALMGSHSLFCRGCPESRAAPSASAPPLVETRISSLCPVGTPEPLQRRCDWHCQVQGYPLNSLLPEGANKVGGNRASNAV